MSEKNRESLKGKWNKIGAPPKKVHWPIGKFNRERLFARNPDQCPLTLINKVNAAIGPVNGQGEIFELVPKKQPNGSVGAPKCIYIRRELFDPTIMTVRDRKMKKAKVVPAAPVVATVIEPAAPPIVPIAPVDLPVITPTTLAQ